MNRLFLIFAGLVILIGLGLTGYWIHGRIDKTAGDKETNVAGQFTDEQRMHHYLGIELNNQAWSLLDKPSRDDKDNQRMLYFAQGSLYHWQRSPKLEPVNTQRGEWLISRVYCVLGNGDEALKHAQECMRITREQAIGDLDLAFAHEAMARALAICGKTAESREAAEQARAAAANIKEKEDRDYFLGELAKGPWGR